MAYIESFHVAFEADAREKKKKLGGAVFAI